MANNYPNTLGEKVGSSPREATNTAPERLSQARSISTSVWQNTNGLIRQNIPKGSDFSEVSDDYIAEVQKILDNRPRKRLGFRPPLEVASELHPDFFYKVALSN